MRLFARWEGHWRRYVPLSPLLSSLHHSLTGHAIVAVGVYSACLDGALHLWKTNSNLVRPDQTIEGAHTKGTETGSLVFSVDGRTLLTRGGDDTVKCASQPLALFD